MHVNDWPSSLTTGLSRLRGAKVPSILTIHNLAYQGLFDPECMPRLAIPQEAFNVNGVEFHGRVSFLKSGIDIRVADHHTSVPPMAREITTPEFGCGWTAPSDAHGRRARLRHQQRIDDSWEPREIPVWSAASMRST